MGACIGEAVAGKKLGKRAMLFGAVAQSFPDIDFVASFWLPTAEYLPAHRGFTHSILFCAVITALAAFVVYRWYQKKIPIKTWLLLFGVNIFGHIFLDAFNAYGTGWLEPFSHARISFHSIFVADPFFSTVLLIAFVVLLILKPNQVRRRVWAGVGIGYCCFYLLYSQVNKAIVAKEAAIAMAKQGIRADQYFVSPTPLNNWLWYVVARKDSGMYVGYRSIFDRSPAVDFQYFPQNNYLLGTLANHEDLPHLMRFSQGYYTIEKWGDTLVFNDLRFGQMIGWHNPRERFVFHYFLQPPADNKLVVQRGRFAKWDNAVFRSLVKKIEGKK